MSASPMGAVPFTAIGRQWTLKMGYRQRFEVERVFGIGFPAAILRIFPFISPDAVAAGDAAAVAAAMKPEMVMTGSISMLFGCCIVERPDDSEVEAILDDLGIERQCELLGDALAAAAPPEPGKGVAADAAPGEARAGKTRKR